MTGKEYTNLAMRTNDGKSAGRLTDKILEYHRFNGDLPGMDKTGIKDIGGILNACLGLSGEVGETVDMIKKWIFHESQLDETHLKKEIGDIMWYNCPKVDAIEVDPTLRQVLKGDERCNLIWDNFLTFRTEKHYDLIAMNPPFSEGSKHLMRAIDLAESNGGDTIIMCILNAETLLNPYTNERKGSRKQRK